MTYQEFQSLIEGSKSYEFDGEILEITGYYTGKRVKLNLGYLTKDMFEYIQVVSENYRGYDMENQDGAWIVHLENDDIICDSLEEAKDYIDQYIDDEEMNY